jgi:hypothetical protein
MTASDDTFTTPSEASEETRNQTAQMEYTYSASTVLTSASNKGKAIIDGD